MKNILTLITFLIVASSAWAQTVARTEEYCEFTLAGASGSNGRYSIRLDDGSERFKVLQFQPDRLRSENGDVILFNSAMDALNYLNGYGWELFTIRGDSSGTYYVMRRKIASSDTPTVPRQ